VLIATLTLVLLQLALAVTAPARFIYFALWIQAIPYTWTWNAQSVFDTPLGPLNVIAMQLFGFNLACLLIVAAHFGDATSRIGNYKWHLVFFAFCLISLGYAPSAAYGLRMIMKLIGPPLFMITILVVAKEEAELQRMRQAIFGSGIVLVALALLARAMGINSDPNAVNTGLSGLGPPGMGPPVFSAHMLPVAMLALAAFVCEQRLSRLLLALLSAAAIVAALQRTSAAALYLGVAIILFLGTRGVWRLLLPSVALIGAPILFLLSDTFRRRMFMGNVNSQDLLADPAKALGSVNSSGRFALWDSMLQKFFRPHPIIGSGIGSTQDYLYRLSAAGRGVVHSEYVRLLCEVGAVGLILFAIAAASYALRLRRCTARTESLKVRQAGLAALGSLLAYLVFFSTDNGFDYVNQFGIYVFALIAIADKSRELAKLQPELTAEHIRPMEPSLPNLMH
jgi:hypothetical protein